MKRKWSTFSPVVKTLRNQLAAITLPIFIGFVAFLGTEIILHGEPAENPKDAPAGLVIRAGNVGAGSVFTREASSSELEDSDSNEEFSFRSLTFTVIIDQVQSHTVAALHQYSRNRSLMMPGNSRNIRYRCLLI